MLCIFSAYAMIFFINFAEQNLIKFVWDSISRNMSEYRCPGESFVLYRNFSFFYRWRYRRVISIPGFVPEFPRVFVSSSRFFFFESTTFFSKNPDFFDEKKSQIGDMHENRDFWKPRLELHRKQKKWSSNST